MKKSLHNLIQALKELNNPTILLMILFGVLPSYVAWTTISVTSAGVTSRHILLIQAIAASAMALFLIMSIKFDFSGKRWLERLFVIAPAIGMAGLTIFNNKLSITLILSMIVIIFMKFLRTCNYTVALPTIQSGESKKAKLAMVMMLIPTASAISYAIIGFIAELHVNASLIFMASTLAALYTYLVVKNKDMKLIPSRIRIPKQVLLKSKIIMLANAIYAAPYYVLVLAVIPLYLNDKTHGNFGLIGVILSLICFISIISKSIKASASDRHINTMNIAITSLLSSATAFGLWAYSENILVVTITLAIHTLAHRMFSYGILSELEDSDPKSYGEFSKIKEIFQMGAGAIAFALCALFSQDVILNIDSVLIAFAITYIALAGLLFTCKFIPKD